MRLFLDTNILIDLVANREPFSKWAYKILLDQKNPRWTLFTSSNSILTIYYIIEKQIGHNKAKKTINTLLSRLEIETIEKQVILRALVANFKDFEDAIQHECALKIEKLDYIVTRNKKDLKESVIPILSSEELYNEIK